MTPTLTDLAVDAAAAYRLTKLVTDDEITRPIRDAVVAAAYGEAGEEPPADGTWTDLAIVDGPDAPRLAYLVTCRWCAGVWVAAGVVAARRAAPRAWTPIAEALALAAAAALLARLED